MEFYQMTHTLYKWTLAFSFFLILSGNAFAQPVYAEITTNKGNITLELYPDKAPETVKNFMRYVNDAFYDGTVFHRVIKDFMIQGGGFNAVMMKKDTHEPVKNEAKNGLKNLKGSIAMARTSAPHSATAQFFINHKDNAFLDYPGQDGWGYCVFGKVIEGMDVVNAIAATATTTKNQMGNVPSETVLIESIRVVSAPVANVADATSQSK